MATFLTRFAPIAPVQERIRRRPDGEHSHALLRLVFAASSLLYVAVIGAQEADGGVGLWLTSLASTATSLFLLSWCLLSERVSTARRVASLVHDNVAVTIWLYLAGPAGALFVFAYPFVTVGNGFLFGIRYLAASGILGAVGIASLVLLSPAWEANRTVGLGILISHVFVNVYVAWLLAHMHRMQRKLQMIATHDPLTGLPNRRLFLDTLSGLLAVEQRGGLACLYLDLDGFKAVNDRAGHPTGDRLLQMVADAISGCVRVSDLVARLGGDEFAVILAGLTGPDRAEMMGQRIVAAIHAIREANGHQIDVSTAVGIVFLADHTALGHVKADDVVKAADEAMYAAKRTGRGELRLADWPGMPHEIRSRSA